MRNLTIGLIVATAALTFACSGDAPPAPGAASATPTSSGAPTAYPTLDTGTSTGTSTGETVTVEQVSAKVLCNQGNKVYDYKTETCSTTMALQPQASCTLAWAQTQFAKCVNSEGVVVPALGTLVATGCSPVTDTCTWKGITPLTAQGYAMDQCGVDGKTIKVFMLKDNSLYVSTNCTQL